MITRALNIIAVGALIGSAVYAYAIKYETMKFSAEIVKAEHEIERERDAIGLLRAEWAHLSRPGRVQALVDRYLDLQLIAVDQVVKANDIPERAAKVDMIGRKLESLGMGEPTATPRDDGARSSTPSPRTR